MSILHKTEVPVKTTAGRGNDQLAASEELPASVISACFPADISTQNATQSNYPSLKHEHLTVQCKGRREKEAMRKRMYQQKLKDERKTLQETVEDLTLCLEELKQGNQSTSLEVLDSNWRGLAVKEREKLLTSEAEQMHLLAAAEANTSCIKELCKQLPIPGAECSHSPVKSDSGTTQPPAFPTSPPFDHAMFRGHLRRVYESYAHTDSALDFKSMDEGVVTSVKRREINNEVEYFEHRNKFSVPFSYAYTERRLWELGKHYRRQEYREHLAEVAGSDYIFAVGYRVVQTLATGATRSVLKRYVVCRFAEDNRFVFVWKTHSEGEGIFRGVHSDETGWARVQPFSTDEDVAEALICVRQAPVRFGISTSSDIRIEEFHQMLHNSFNEDLIEVTSELDKLLLDDALSGIDI